MLFLFYVLLIPVSMVLRGWVISKLWTWFIVSTFHAAPLTLAQAYGIVLVYGAISYKGEEYRGDLDKRSRVDKAVAGFVYAILFPVAALGLGLIVRHWL